MQVVKSIIMEELKIIDSGFIITDIGKNNISKTGCIWLSKADWKKLINVCFGKIEDTKPTIIFVGKALNT